MHRNVFAYTAPGCDMPEFVSINDQGEYGYVMTARSQGADGHTIDVQLPKAVLRRLCDALSKEFPAVGTVGGFDDPNQPSFAEFSREKDGGLAAEAVDTLRAQTEPMRNAVAEASLSVRNARRKEFEERINGQAAEAVETLRRPVNAMEQAEMDIEVARLRDAKRKIAEDKAAMYARAAE